MLDGQECAFCATQVFVFTVGLVGCLFVGSYPAHDVTKCNGLERSSPHKGEDPKKDSTVNRSTEVAMPHLPILVDKTRML